MQPVVSLRAVPIGDDTAIFDLSDQLLNNRMIDAHDSKAIERDILHKGQIGLLGLFEAAVMIEMFRIDIGDNHHICRELYKRAIRLI